MSYFDHVRCHACRASLDPDQIGKQGMTCPKCGTQLSLTDLFGVKASFAEEDLPDLGLDDLVGKVAQPGADWKPLQAPPKRAPGTAPAGVTARSPTAAPSVAPNRAVGGAGTPAASRPIPVPARPAPPSPQEPARQAPQEPPRPAAATGRTAPPVRSIGLNGSAPRPAPSGSAPAATGRMAAPPSGGARPAPVARPEDGQLVRVARDDDPDDAPMERPAPPPRRIPGQTSAADLMKALKRKK